MKRLHAAMLVLLALSALAAHTANGYLGSRLDEIAAITPTDDMVLIGNGTSFVGESGATLRTSLDVQQASTFSRTLSMQTNDVALSATGDGHTYSVGAGTCDGDGDAIMVEAYGSISTFTGSFRIAVGSTTLVTISTTNASADWLAAATIVRTGAATSDAFASIEVDQATNVPTYTASAPAVTWANANTVKTECTARTLGTVTLKGIRVRYQKRP